MIKFEHTEVMGWEAAIRGMRNPKNSWEKSDSFRPGEWCEDEYCVNCESRDPLTGKCQNIGPNDLDLMRRLAAGGPVHAKYRRMIAVYVDITAPLYWWKEFDTYKVGTVVNSCSTMHKIADKEFTLEDFSTEHLTKRHVDFIKETIDKLNDVRGWCLKYDYMSEQDRGYFVEEIKCKKDLWWQIIQLLPSSYNQRRTIMCNYETLTNIYKSRKDHKLDEWKTFCNDWIKNLPYSDLITGEDENEKR